MERSLRALSYHPRTSTRRKVSKISGAVISRVGRWQIAVSKNTQIRTWRGMTDGHLIDLNYSKSDTYIDIWRRRRDSNPR
ncbi:hypothetical protein CHELA20_50720 [Hyphomicrobiales bacterium]|nr:hypothetical protein CHELA20_50720 [Hyphomicrobiales bacterium]